MLGLDKLFEYYCSANHITAEQMNKMIICLLAIVVIIQIVTAIINIFVQFMLKKKDIRSSFVSITYSSTRAIYEDIYKMCKDVYRNIITSSNILDIDESINGITIYIGDKDIHIAKKIRSLSDDIVDKLHVFNHNRSRFNNDDLNKSLNEFKAEFNNHDNY